MKPGALSVHAPGQWKTMHGARHNRLRLLCVTRELLLFFPALPVCRLLSVSKSQLSYRN